MIRDVQREVVARVDEDSHQTDRANQQVTDDQERMVPPRLHMRVIVNHSDYIANRGNQSNPGSVEPGLYEY